MSQIQRIQVYSIKVLYVIINGSFDIFRKMLWPKKRPRKAERVGIYRIGNIGDILCALPAMYAIRQAYPSARLTLISSPGKQGMPGAKELLQGADWLDELVIYYSKQMETRQQHLEFIHNLRRKKFDVWIELPNDLVTIRHALRNMLLARSSGALWAYGWKLNTLKIAVQAQSELFHYPCEVERLLTLVRNIGIDEKKVIFPLPLTYEHHQKTGELLNSFGADGAKLIALAPGAKRKPNRWPEERFVTVGRYVRQLGYSVVLLGGSSEDALCQRIADGIGEGCINLAGRSSLLVSAAVLSLCTLLICNDSGVQHLASAVGTPCISLFSCRDVKGKWYPHGEKNIVLRKWIECHICYLEQCPYDNACIKLITTDDVIHAVAQKIKS
jgi:ADP-heptose:LPS heptosyltransferase